MNEPEMEALLKATKKATPESSKRKKRLPYTPQFISVIRAHFDLSNPFKAAVYACLTTTFYACTWVGEFAIPILTAFKPNSHIKPSNVSSERDRNGLESTTFQLPHTKTSIHGETVEQQNLHKAVAWHTLSLPLLFTEVLVLQVLRTNPSEVY